MEDENTKEEYSIYRCHDCSELSPAVSFGTDSGKTYLLCLFCRTALDTEQQPEYYIGEYGLYRIGWSAKKIARMVEEIRGLLAD